MIIIMEIIKTERHVCFAQQAFFCLYLFNYIFIRVYNYDPVRNLLISATINGKTTKYDYYPTDYMRSATYPDGRREVFEYSPEGYMTSRTIMEDEKSLAQMQYVYDGKAQVTRLVNPGNISVISTYNELGEVAASHRRGSLKETFIKTVNTRSIYEGDSVSNDFKSPDKGE